MPCSRPEGWAARPTRLSRRISSRTTWDRDRPACAAHGFPKFPDPTFPDGRISLSIPSSINTKSTQFALAAQTCTRLIPAGLPYSHRGG